VLDHIREAVEMLDVELELPEVRREDARPELAAAMNIRPVRSEDPEPDEEQTDGLIAGAPKLSAAAMGGFRPDMAPVRETETEKPLSLTDADMLRRAGQEARGERPHDPVDGFGER
jgi:hypothetical protein